MKPEQPRRLTVILRSLVCGLLLAIGLPAAAQSGGDQPAVEIPEHLTREEVRDLVARLSDDEVRELIIQQLDKLAAAEAQVSAESVYFERLSLGFEQARESLQRSLDTSERPIRTLFADIGLQMTVGGKFGASFLLMHLIALLAAGLAVELLIRRILRRVAPLPEKLSGTQKFNFAFYDTAVGAIAIGGFAGGAALGIESLAGGMPAAEIVWYQLVALITLVRLVMLVMSRILAPASPRLRLVALDDNSARAAWLWSLLLTVSLLLPNQLGKLVVAFDASEDTMLLMSVLFGAIFVALVIALIVRLRAYGARLIVGDGNQAGALRLGLARAWWVLAIGYVLAIWLMSLGKRAATGESSLVPGISSLLLVAAIPYFDHGLKWLIAWYFQDRKPSVESASAGTAEAVPAAAQQTAEVAAETRQAPEYLAVALRYGRVLMVLAILTIFVRLWDINIAAISAQLVGERFARASFDIGITILLTWALWGVIRIAIERKIAEDKGPEGADDDAEAGGMGGTRLGTVLPLIRAFIQITLIVMAVLISLSALGVNIGPLIAGAGVVGLAIGFGAQTLVRDIVSGFFYLVDDAFRIGEYVVVDQTRGTVEKISIRSFQLRHHNGPVHTVPYGEIRTLTNWSRDWAIMKFELRIPFETDIDKVRKIIKKIGQELMEDETFGPLLLAPLKSQGVNRMDDSALIIRCKFTAVPGQQYLIRREAFTRIQRVFEEQGIHFAPRRVLVEATTPQAAVEAAAGAIDNEADGQQKKGGADEP